MIIPKADRTKMFSISRQRQLVIPENSATSSNKIGVAWDKHRRSHRERLNEIPTFTERKL